MCFIGSDQIMFLKKAKCASEKGNPGLQSAYQVAAQYEGLCSVSAYILESSLPRFDFGFLLQLSNINQITYFPDVLLL